ncbi:hypothetical protein [Rhodococcoides fascians]|uniref:hypothetical protein n=1 Tax=Rhodococcoides fascians TaxID=1828 RepID=UPI000AE4A7B9|nr:hypothetical protein [Rhodococcus fascians]
MTLYLISAAVIVAACYGLYLALQESDAERALTFPLGSPERLILEGGRHGSH